MIAIVCLGIIFGFDTPATAAFFQRYYPSKIRATMSSIESLIGSLVLVTASVTTGYFLDQYTFNTLYIAVFSVTFMIALITGVASIKLPKLNLSKKRDDRRSEL